MNFYSYQELTPNGDPIGQPERLSWEGLKLRVSISCPKYPRERLAHMIALLMSAGNKEKNPVDLVLFSADGNYLLWNARVYRAD